MPHLFTNRPRLYNPITKNKTRNNSFDWESINAILYIVGGLTFIAGSIFFLPRYDTLSDTGAWIFFGGSLVYLLVTGHDLLESTNYLRRQKHRVIWNWLEFIIANVYVGGTILFTVGSLLFLSQIDAIVAGGWCFTIGSLFFLIGACLNVIQIVKEGSFVKLQLLNATAISFAIGSTLFLIASMPYLSKALNLEDNKVLFAYVGWEYIFGSILFFLGGIINYYRSYQRKHYYQQDSVMVKRRKFLDYAKTRKHHQDLPVPYCEVKIPPESEESEETREKERLYFPQV